LTAAISSRVTRRVLETYAVLEQAYENVDFTAIRRAANDCAYSTRHHFAVLALLRAASYHLRFRVTVCDTYRQQLPHEFHAHTSGYALSNDYLKVRESMNRAVAKCISRCVIFPIFET